MSLATQISALASTVAAAVKALTARVTTLEGAALATVSHTTGDTLADSDAGKIAELDGGTLYLDASVLTANNAGLVRQTGTTAVTVVAASGTTIYPAGARTTAGQGCLLSWQARSSSLAYVNGETA